MQLEIKTSKKSFTRHYLELLNGILKLTPRELDSLLLFLEYDQEVACSMQARKHVADAMSFKSVSVLNNYVKSLKDKQVIYKDKSGVYRYNDIVKPMGTLSRLPSNSSSPKPLFKLEYEIETLDVLFAFELQLSAELEGQNILYDTEIFIGRHLLNNLLRICHALTN